MTDRAASGLKVHELSKQFGTSPQKIAPKVLSLTAKVTKETAAVTPIDEFDSIMTDEDGDIDRANGSLSDSSVHQTDSESDDASSAAEMGPQLRTMAPTKPATVASTDYIIGLDQLQEQVRRLALRRGFTLNLMVVGKFNILTLIDYISTVINF